MLSFKATTLLMVLMGAPLAHAGGEMDMGNPFLFDPRELQECDCAVNVTGDDVTYNCTDGYDPTTSPVTVEISGNCSVTEVTESIENDSGTVCTGLTSTETTTVTASCGEPTVFTRTLISDPDTTPPVQTVPGDATVECSAVPPLGNLDATDACTDDSTINSASEEQRTDGTCTGEYTLQRTFTATDTCDNTVTDTQTINVQDTTPPVFSGLNETLSIECDAIPTQEEDENVLVAADACGSAVTVTFEETPTTGSCAQEYTLTRTWTATDDCTNEGTFTRTIEVFDNSAPDLTGPDQNINGICERYNQETNGLTVRDVVVNDNCAGSGDEFVISYIGFPDSLPECPFTLTRNWTIADPCGNEATYSQTIEFSSNLIVSIILIPVDIIVGVVNIAGSIIGGFINIISSPFG